MKKKALDIFSLAAGICSFVGVLYIPDSEPKILLLVILIVSVIAILVPRLFPKPNVIAVNAVQNLLKPADNAPRFIVEKISNPAQLKALWELDEKCYGDENISFSTLREWWESYQEGIFVLLDCQHKIVGAIGIFPIREAPFNLLIEGKLAEQEINSNIIDARNCGNCWYVSGIVLDVRFRKTRAIVTLIYESLVSWSNNLKGGRRIRIGSIAYTRAGENLLKRFKFYCNKHADESISKHPTYLYESDDEAELKRIISNKFPQNPENPHR